MYFNFLDLFSIKAESNKGKVFEFLSDEYEEIFDEKINTTEEINLIFKKDKGEEHDYIVRDPVSYDRKGVYIFDLNRKKLRLDFDTIGDNTCQIICDPDFHPPFFAILVDFLAYIYALKKRRILCHSSGLVLNDKSLIFPAWRNVGKTNILLSFLNEKATYLADDWSLITSKGEVLVLPKKICLFDYNLSQFPFLINKIDYSLASLYEFSSLLKEGKVEIDHNIEKEINENLRIHLDPQEIFGSKKINSIKQINYIFMLTKNVFNPEKGVYSKNIQLDVLIESIFEIMRFEQTPFRLAYSVYKSRFGKKNVLIEEEKEIFSQVANSAFRNSELFEIFTPNQTYTSQVKETVLKILGTN